MGTAFRSVAAAVLGTVALLGTGCRGGGDATTTRPSAPPPADATAPVPLVARLVVTPATVRVTAGPSTQPVKAVTLRMTLVVSNVTGRVYTGESPDAAVARFALTLPDGSPLWSHPQAAAQAVTPVTLGPGQEVTYHAMVTIPDARPYRGQVLTARAQFAPAAITVSQSIPVN